MCVGGRGVNYSASKGINQEVIKSTMGEERLLDARKVDIQIMYDMHAVFKMDYAILIDQCSSFYHAM